MTDLSKRAQALLSRVQDKGRWYRADGREPQAMQELVDAGLVTTAMRRPVYLRCYVPAGYNPGSDEKYPPTKDQPE